MRKQWPENKTKTQTTTKNPKQQQQTLKQTKQKNQTPHDQVTDVVQSPTPAPASLQKEKTIFP